jgi:hypothetical protein
LCGCAAALIPGVPAGPIAAPGLRLGTSYTYAQAPATVHAKSSAGEPVTVRANSAMLWVKSTSWS